MKVCRICEQSLPLDQYYTRTNGTIRHECKQCWSIANTKARLLRQYGLEYDNWLNMMKQGCQICGKLQETENRKSVLSVDHDHSRPGTHRGLLCDSCNHGIGLFRDDTSLLIKAAEYLKKTEESAQ